MGRSKQVSRRICGVPHSLAIHPEEAWVVLLEYTLASEHPSCLRSMDGIRAKHVGRFGMSESQVFKVGLKLMHEH
jgi:hypothetical protein